MDLLLRILRLVLWRPVQAIRFLLRLPRMLRRNRKAVLATVAALLSCAIAADRLLPHRHLPWRGLDIDERAGFSTDWKLLAIRSGPASWCENLLAGSRTLTVTTLDEHDGEGRCGWSSAVDFAASSQTRLTGSTAVPMRCPLAAGAHIWLTGVDRHAQDLLGSPLARVHHAGTYSCRRMYNRASGRLSQHAYANAWDVTGFELADGRVVSVLKHWPSRGKEGRFLRAVRDEACRIFTIVLGPDYNAAHRDHFHVDMSVGARCS